MKKLYTLLLVTATLLSADKLYSQYASQVTQFPFITGPKADGAPMCVGGLVYDDGTWENGYGWNPGFGTGKWVMKFTPLSYPWTMNQFCIALTRVSAGSPTWTFDIEIWDTTGAGGSPGTLIHSITNQTASGIPIWTSVQWFDFNNLTGVPPLQNGSYYVGISYTPTAGQYVGADQSSTTPLRPGYGYIQNAWGTIQSYFSGYRAMGIRVDGTGQVLAHDYAVGPFLSLPSIFTVGQVYSIKAEVTNVGSSNETGVPIKFFVDNTQAGSTTLSLNAGASDSVAFPWTAAGGGYHTLRIFSQLSTDLNRANDTVSANIYVLSGIPLETWNGCRHGLNIPITTNSTIRDSILVSVPYNACYISDVNVRIDTVYHTWDADLQFFIAHHGVEVNIIDQVGGGGDNFIGTNLNDSATIPIASGTAPFTGTYIPSNPLSALNGNVGYGNVGGYWILKIHNTSEPGTLKAWCLTITYYLCEGGIQTVTIPNYYALKQNYPNPFNPSTKIEYYIPRTGNVKLTVYDIMGREVAALVNEYKNPGIYNIDFNASSLSSGVYFYKMESGSFTDTKKMLLIK